MEMRFQSYFILPWKPWPAYPIVGMLEVGAEIRANFGRLPFTYKVPKIYPDNIPIWTIDVTALAAKLPVHCMTVGCAELFKSVKDMLRHFNMKCVYLNPFECVICGCRSNKKEICQRHVQNWHHISKELSVDLTLTSDK